MNELNQLRHHPFRLYLSGYSNDQQHGNGLKKRGRMLIFNDQEDRCLK